MQLEITKRCADSLRSFSQNQFGVQIKSSHAHELVAAYMGYSSRAALLADSKCPITNLRQAEILVLTPTAPIRERRAELKGLPENLPDDIAEGVYLPLYNEKWILHKIWPTLEELGKALADQHLKSKPAYFGDQAVQRHGVKLEFHNGEVAIVVFREYVSPSLTLSLMRNVTRSVVDVFLLKRVACHIGYVLAKHHTTEAETLDAAAEKMRDVYHGIISPQSHNEVTLLATSEPSFTDWLTKHKNRDSPLGDLANRHGFADRDGAWPSYNNLEAYQDYLKLNNPPLGAMSALERAWKTYETFLKRKRSPNSNKRATRPVLKKHDPRTIVFVKNVTPLHYLKRTAEKFSVGDKAWVSWDGRKAIPVTILEVDERHYSFRTERPIKNAGSRYSLFLDEVRSTPELACINRVTS
ncbi:MAG: YozE family protein [Bacteroidota bacterium]